MTSKILGWGEYIFPSVEIKLMNFVFMLYKTSCLLFLCSTRLHVFCFYALQDFKSSIFMLHETSLLHFFKSDVLINLRIDTLQSMFIFLKAYLFYTYTIIICNFSVLLLMTSKILGWGEYVFPSVEIKLLPSVFMLYKTSCLMFLCFMRLHCCIFLKMLF